jgi:hypothetical protein
MALGLTGSTVSAFSPATTALEGADNLVQRTGGCHRSCEWGPARGWHRHVGARCIPVACAPRAAYPNRCWVDYRGVRHCRW